MRFAPATGDKETRCKPVSAQAEAGNVKLVRGLWNDEFLRVLENFPAGRHDDEVDALSGAYERVADASTGAWTAEAVKQASVGGGDSRLPPLRQFVSRFSQHYGQSPSSERFGREKTLSERGIIPIDPNTRAAI